MGRATRQPVPNRRSCTRIFNGDYSLPPGSQDYLKINGESGALRDGCSVPLPASNEGSVGRITEQSIPNDRDRNDFSQCYHSLLQSHQDSSNASGYPGVPRGGYSKLLPATNTEGTSRITQRAVTNFGGCDGVPGGDCSLLLGHSQRIQNLRTLKSPTDPKKGATPVERGGPPGNNHPPDSLFTDTRDSSSGPAMDLPMLEPERRELGRILTKFPDGRVSQCFPILYR
ncbi:hypothetical protein HOY80DRAFT_1099000 [Tuber brumale]|nr:hypothetical protein HOY80DRAFT_1099000 [Tuber brumale]